MSGFINPFDLIGQPKLDNPKGELVTESSLACQELGCYEIVKEGRYIEEVGLLTWKCSNGHVSKIEGFSLD